MVGATDPAKPAVSGAGEVLIGCPWMATPLVAGIQPAAGRWAADSREPYFWGLPLLLAPPFLPPLSMVPLKTPTPKKPKYMIAAGRF